MSQFLVLPLVWVILLLHFTSGRASDDSSVQTYIVHVELPGAQVASDESFDLESYYQSFMPTTTSESSEPRRIIFSYRHVFPGFAAKLTANDVKEMSKKSGFLMANHEEILPLHTTHSPDFLGLHQGSGVWEGSHYGKGKIIAVLDTGIKSSHPSFDDSGMPPPPSTWKGKCDPPITCNNKIIGAQSFIDKDTSPEDTNGHGTHTASIAAGSRVEGANVFGNANGTAIGIAPLAHLAIYKVCGAQGCPDSAILAGMDKAIGDGTDVISKSVSGSVRPYYSHSTSIGAFSAMRKNIVVSCSAGNLGPIRRTISNEAPWILTVAASTMDRKIVATLVLGDGQELNGQYLNQPSNWIEKPYKLVYPDVSTCKSFRGTEVKGKVVVCGPGGGITSVQKAHNVKAAGGVAMIYPNTETTGYTLQPPIYPIAATDINYEDAEKLLAYYESSTSTPTVIIKFRGTQLGDKNAPAIADFSSRGPGLMSPYVLKPDITAPGVNILAAWPFSVENYPNTKKTFNIISGTSMSCPHVSGMVILMKSARPDWSPAAIKSALATTATPTNLDGKPILDQKHLTAHLYATGSGHVNPARAMDPGLVYDIGPEDYQLYLCSIGYTSAEIKMVTQSSYTCPAKRPSPSELNYPSFTVDSFTYTQTVTRTLTNVAQIGEDEVYTVTFSPPREVKVEVKPDTLVFTEFKQKLKYEVTFTTPYFSSGTTDAGHITWASSKHSVRSPIVVYS